MSAGIQPIVMPKWGLAMQEGMVAAWHVRPGAELGAGQEICDIETSKIANIFESPVAGTLRRIVAEPGATLPVGALIAVVADPAVDDATIDVFVAEFQARFETEGSAEVAPEPQSIDTAAGRLRYLQLGEGKATPVLLLHGFGGDLNNWLFNQEALAEDREVFALDLPGHGGSTKDVGDGTLVTLARAVEAFMEAVHLHHVHLVGHSMGGAVALEVAAAHPDRVRSLTLLAPAGLGPDINRAFVDDFIAQNRPRKLKQVLAHLVHDPDAVTDAMVEDVVKFKRLDGAIAALERLRDGILFRQPDIAAAHAKLRGLGCPIHVVWGAEDRILSAGHAMGLPSQVTVTHLERTGHMPHMERAAEVNALIRRLVDGSHRP
ncbi:MAG: acetoin dehydrogenase dihydrolipoyllysine-residue acetyltransferase subunit [Pseudomonadota bacterium]